jgi:phage shock protein E
MKTPGLILILLCAALMSVAQQRVRNVSAAEFSQLLNKEHVLIDLRTASEINKKGKIPGAVTIDFLSQDAEAQIKALDKNKTYLVYCAGGGRSADCAALMEESGFKEVINLEKGFDDWKSKGLKTEQSH